MSSPLSLSSLSWLGFSKAAWLPLYYQAALFLSLSLMDDPAWLAFCFC